MITHVPVLFSFFLHYFVLVILATSSIRVDSSLGGHLHLEHVILQPEIKL